MGFDRGRRGERGGRGRDKRDSFGDDSFGGGKRFLAVASMLAAVIVFGGGGDRFGGGGGPVRRRRRKTASAAVAGGGGDRFGGGGGGGKPLWQPTSFHACTGCWRRLRCRQVFSMARRASALWCAMMAGKMCFVHISAVEQAGLTGLAEGQPLKFTLVDRGGKISATDSGDRRRNRFRLKIVVLRVIVNPAAVVFDRGGDRGGFGGGDRGGAPQRTLTGESSAGTVKFFNAMKGFGFIQRDDGQPDAFVSHLGRRTRRHEHAERR